MNPVNPVNPELLRLLDLINGARNASGLFPLRLNDRLSQAAQGHSEDLAAGGFLSHGGSNGSTLAQRIEAAGYAWQSIGENVLCRTLMNTQGALDQWWYSEGHRANLLGADFTDTGLGLAYSPKVDCWYYVQVLARA